MPLKWLDPQDVSTYASTLGDRGEQVDDVSSAQTCNALLIYPRFEADTFWSFKRTSEVFGANIRHRRWV